MVVQADDVTTESLIDMSTIRCHECQCIIEANFLAKPYMMGFHAFRILARTNAHKRHTIAMLWVHIRLNLERESGELGFSRLNFTRHCRTHLRLRCILDKIVKQFGNTKVIDRRAEIHWCQLTSKVGVSVERMTCPFYQFELFTQFLCHITENLIKLRVVDPLHNLSFLYLAAMRGRVEMYSTSMQVVDTFESLAHTNWPGNRRTANIEHAFDFIHQFDGIPPLSIELVDESHYRCGT